MITKSIESKIIKLSKVDWRSLRWIQTKLKDLTKDSFDRLKTSLKNNNYIMPMHVWEDPKGIIWILDGHHRQKAMESLAAEGHSIPKKLDAVFIDCQDKKDAAKKVLIFSSLYAHITDEGLYEFLSLNDLDIKEIMPEIDMPDIDIVRFNENFYEEKGGLTNPDDVPEPPKRAKAKFGDLYILGNHRLLCGDATIKKDVDKLMAGKKADMVFTDPPYNANYNPDEAPRASSRSDMSKINKRKLGGIINDKMPQDEYDKFLFSVFDNMIDILIKGSVFYLCCNYPSDVDYTNALRNNSVNISGLIVWDKGAMILDRKDYHASHELIIYGWKIGKPHLFSGGYAQTDTWPIKRDSFKDYEHPTQKPVALSAKAIRNHKANNILDLFGGSGSTLIACEQLNRKCYMMEIDPLYISVILDRWAAFTGREPVRERDNKKWSKIIVTVLACKNYKDRIEISADSGVFWGLSGHKENNLIKIHEINSIIFASTGWVSESNLFNIFCATQKPAGIKEIEILNFFVVFREWQQNKLKIIFESKEVIKNDYIFVFEYELYIVNSNLTIRRILVGEFDAIGAGMVEAKTALYLGKKPKEAVEVCLKLNCFTSGIIQEKIIKKHGR